MNERAWFALVIRTVGLYTGVTGLTQMGDGVYTAIQEAMIRDEADLDVIRPFIGELTAWLVASLPRIVIGTLLCMYAENIVAYLMPAIVSHCPHCRYKIAGLSVTACPECGTAVPRTTPIPPPAQTSVPSPNAPNHTP